MKHIHYILFSTSIFFLFSCSEANDKRSEKTEIIGDTITNLHDSTQASYPSSIFPIDESSSSPSLSKQLASLNEAILLKDTTILFALMDSNIVSSHGGAIYGLEGVLEVWEGKDIWKKLNQIANLGGVFNNTGNEFRLPYCQADKFYGSWDIDWYSTGVVLNSNTSLFIKPDSTSNVIDKLEYSILETIDYSGDEPANGMLHVKTLKNNKEGFIKYSDFYGTSDYMLIFKKQENGNWLISSFAPYD